MNKLYHAIEAMEAACETQSQLIGFQGPQLTQILAAVRALPKEEREALRARLERINTIIEGQMMLYAEEMERLRKQINHVGRSNKATQTYRTVAVIPVKPANNNG